MPFFQVGIKAPPKVEVPEANRRPNTYTEREEQAKTRVEDRNGKKAEPPLAGTMPINQQATLVSKPQHNMPASNTAVSGYQPFPSTKPSQGTGGLGGMYAGVGGGLGAQSRGAGALDPMGSRMGGANAPGQLAPLSKNTGTSVGNVGGGGGGAAMQGSYARNARYRPGVQPVKAAADKLPALEKRPGVLGGYRNSAVTQQYMGGGGYSRHDW